MKYSWNTTPANSAPMARMNSGTSITIGNSCTWCITSWLARGVPWNVMKISRQE